MLTVSQAENKIVNLLLSIRVKYFFYPRLAANTINTDIVDSFLQFNSL